MGGPPGALGGCFLGKLQHRNDREILKAYQSGSNSPPGPYLDLMHKRYPISLQQKVY